MARVKICGVTTAAALDAAVEAGADWIGLNFFPASPRYVSPAQAESLSMARAGSPSRVGLFVEPSDADVAAVVRTVRLDVLQIYGPSARAVALRRLFGIPVWHVVGTNTRADLPETAEGIDGLLVEPKPPPGATRPGGNAVVLDWAVTRGWVAPRPWMLAGGLTPGTVAEAVRLSGAPAVDVSSGVESTPGVKDPALIRAFVEAAKRA